MMPMPPKDDYLPKRLMAEPLADGPSNGHSISKSDMDTMLDEYYRLRGWDHDGVPVEEAGVADQ
jgi:aldehyde:ferredoxin oxidoreductase